MIEVDRTEELEKEGWKRQFVANEPRLSEASEMYTQLGYEVHLESLPKEQKCDSCAGTKNQEKQSECRICFAGVEDQYKVIFTRPRKGMGRGNDALF